MAPSRELCEAGGMLRRLALVLAFLAGCADRMAVVAPVQVAVQPVSAPAASATARSAPLARALQFGVGDRVEVEWHGSWWRATILEVEGNRYRIHYDGYGSEWDELVAEDRVRARKAEVDDDPAEPDDDADP